MVRSLAAGAASIVLALAVYPMGSEFFVELAREWGWYAQPGRRVARVTDLIVSITAAAWFPWMGGGIIGFALGTWLDAVLRGRQKAEQPFADDSRPALDVGQDTKFEIEDQKCLSEQLKRYANVNAMAHIAFASVKHMKLAELIESIFSTSGWQTNYTNIPLEAQRYEYIEGIEIFGYNDYLVSAIASDFSEAGLPTVRAKVEKPQVAQGNPKWASVQSFVRITIGHH